MKLDADELGSLKVKDLQRELKKRGLDTSGLKAALLERLKEHLNQEEGAPTEAQDAEQEKEKEEEDEKEKEKEEQEQEQEKEKEKQQEEPQVETFEKEKDPAEAEKAEEEAEANGAEDGEKSEKVVGGKRSVDAVESDGENAPDAKKAKVSDDKEGGSPRPEDDESGKPVSSADADAAMSDENAADGATKTTEAEERLTLRIDNFVRPFTLNAVKALVQEFGNFVEDGFWMDTIKTHCFVTYPSAEIAEKTKDALNGKVWPPENGRSLKVEFVDHTAMEVSKFGEANLPSRPKNKDNTSTQPRQKVTIDEFFQKTETKPVLYYLPLTDEQVKERKERPSQQPEGQPRKRRHRGGRKRNRRGRFQRR
ncbi:hypothetical protein PR003_g2656 [Phytophthora rubi]|uniref:SAP domain-containing protein n=1 Tax=Phytophthora rubi TaxID=129364 RepID=A0A6A3PD41_9STRA|nr:hypothetical protein PR002_g2578 [Phytophthora rubi]KAE9050334.1 hypothetical protein PR001_g2496 [Phytophthora rubi]KAE9355822.1 hypothetical protein PR003_g2656 [Phytophthora rubi]